MAANQKSLKLNAILNILRTALSLVFPLITFPYASRILGPEGIGKVNFAQSIVSYFALIAGLGISAYGIREAAAVRDDKFKFSQFVKEVFVINLISTLIAYILFFIAIFFVPKFSDYRKLLIICGSSIIFTTLGVEWIYSAMEEYLYITIRTIAFQVFTILFLFIFIKSSDDYIKYAGLSVFSSVGSNLCNFVHARKFLIFKETEKIRLKKHLKPIFALFVLALISSVYQVLDTTMLGFLASDEDVGIYTAATKINRIVLSMVVSVGVVILPRLSYLIKSNFEQFNKLALKSIEFTFLLAVPCTVGLCILAKPVIQLLSGDLYFDAVTPMRIMNPIIIIIGVSNFTGVQVFLPLKKEKWTLYSVICGALINFSLNFVLIPKLGVNGAAIATICAEFTVTMVQLIFARKIISIKQICLLIIKYLINSLIMGIPVYCIYCIINDPLLKLILPTVTGMIVYFLVLLVEKNQFLFEILNKLKYKIKCGNNE